MSCKYINEGVILCFTKYYLALLGGISLATFTKIAHE